MYLFPTTDSFTNVYNKKTIIKFFTNVFLYFLIFSTNILTLKKSNKNIIKMEFKCNCKYLFKFCCFSFFLLEFYLLEKVT